MKIVVTGGTALIGSTTVKKALGASTRSRGDTQYHRQQHYRRKLRRCAEDCSVVVDATNSPSSDDAAVPMFFETSTRDLLAYKATGGVGHHAALSVVGTERLVESVSSEQDLLRRRSGMPELKGQVEVDQLVAECDALRQHLDDLRLLVVDLVKENQLLRDRLFRGLLRWAAEIPTEQEIR